MPADIPWASIIAVASALLSFVAEFYVREGLKSQFKSSKAAAAAKGMQTTPVRLQAKVRSTSVEGAETVPGRQKAWSSGVFPGSPLGMS